MTDEQLIPIFQDAWRGVRAKQARFAERYLTDLRKANLPDRRRSLLSELLAEGLIHLGGSEHFQGAQAVGDLFRDGEADGWARVRDLALFASATGSTAK